MKLDLSEPLRYLGVRGEPGPALLAELSGVSRVTITAVKSGKSCSADTARKLAQVLGNKIIVKEV